MIIALSAVLIGISMFIAAQMIVMSLSEIKDKLYDLECTIDNHGYSLIALYNKNEGKKDGNN